MTLPEIQERALGMLKFVDAICKREGLTYWLSGGTLLGAVRHRGFIPWDDDADLMMPRPDYERFLALAQRCSTKEYTIVTPYIRKDYAMPWARVWDMDTRVDLTNMVKFGCETLFLDIFPVEALPGAPWLCELYYRRVRLRDILLKCSRKTDLWGDERLKLLKRALMAATSLLPTNAYARWLDRFCARGSYENARNRGVCLITHYGSRECMPAEVFDGTVNVEFCGEQFPAPAGWDAYLRRLYGDYMQLPPEEKRRSLHYLKAKRVDANDDTEE